MKKVWIAGAILLAGFCGLGLSAWALQLGPEDPPSRAGISERRGGAERLLMLLESDRAKKELGLSDDQVQHLRQVIVDTEKSSVKTGADLAVRGIELRELLRADNPDRDAVIRKVQEISNLRGDLMKQHVEALVAAKKILTPEQQKKVRTFIEMRRAAASRRGRMGRMGMRGLPPRAAPAIPPQPGSAPNPPAR